MEYDYAADCAQRILKEAKKYGVSIKATKDGRLMVRPYGIGVAFRLRIYANKEAIVEELRKDTEGSYVMDYKVGEIRTVRELSAEGIYTKRLSAKGKRLINVECPTCHRHLWRGLHAVADPTVRDWCVHCRPAPTSYKPRPTINYELGEAYRPPNPAAYTKLVQRMATIWAGDWKPTVSGYLGNCPACGQNKVIAIPSTGMITCTACASHIPPEETHEQHVVETSKDMGGKVIATPQPEPISEASMTEALISRLEVLLSQVAALEKEKAQAEDELSNALKRNSNQSNMLVEMKRENDNWKLALEAMQAKQRMSPDLMKRAQAVLATPGEGSLSGKQCH